MTSRSKLGALGFLALSAVGSFLGCETEYGPYTYGETGDWPSPDDDSTAPSPQCFEMPACDAGITVDPAGSALLITDPQVLAKVPLEKVVDQILTLNASSIDSGEMMQRLFDTMNDSGGARFDGVYHCDDIGQPAIKVGGSDTFTCPRAEGALADSTGFFTEGDEDFFFPVAIVNRFDLTPLDGMTCGQYRIVYAKQSGLTDPNNRVFLIFEAALVNPAPGCLEACRPVAQFLKTLEGADSATLAQKVDHFFFTGIDGFLPAVHPMSYGLGGIDDGTYGRETGQVRVSMHMEDPWAMREMRLEASPTDGEVVFTPATVKNNPPASLFHQDSTFWGADAMREALTTGDFPGFAGNTVESIQMFLPNELNGVESMLAGDKFNNYYAAATAGGDMSFIDAMNENLGNWGIGADCPPDDPLDGRAILNRMTALSCAGCHAPTEMFGESRSVGCGLIWPNSIGQAHITETGQLSPALTDVFLPHRAKVMQTFLQACDPEAIFGSFPDAGGMGAKKIDPGRTLGGSRTH